MDQVIADTFYINGSGGTVNVLRETGVDAEISGAGSSSAVVGRAYAEQHRDGGEDPALAFRAATRSAGWEPAEGG